jgi:hypothetical protein
VRFHSSDSSYCNLQGHEKLFWQADINVGKKYSASTFGFKVSKAGEVNIYREERELKYST